MVSSVINTNGTDLKNKGTTALLRPFTNLAGVSFVSAIRAKKEIHHLMTRSVIFVMFIG